VFEFHPHLFRGLPTSSFSPEQCGIICFGKLPEFILFKCNFRFELFILILPAAVDNSIYFVCLASIFHVPFVSRRNFISCFVLKFHISIS
jgi:hypothetical protein